MVSAKPLKEIAKNIESICTVKYEQYKKPFNQYSVCNDRALDN